MCIIEMRQIKVRIYTQYPKIIRMILFIIWNLKRVAIVTKNVNMVFQKVWTTELHDHQRGLRVELQWSTGIASVVVVAKLVVEVLEWAENLDLHSKQTQQVVLPREVLTEISEFSGITII